MDFGDDVTVSEFSRSLIWDINLYIIFFKVKYSTLNNIDTGVITFMRVIVYSYAFLVSKSNKSN